MKLSKNTDLDLEYETFVSIDDLPMMHWIEIHETDNFNYLLKLNSYRKLNDFIPYDEDFEKTIKKFKEKENSEKVIEEFLIQNEKSKHLEEIWETIHDEFIDEIGLSESYLDILEKKSDIAELQCDHIISDDRMIINRINVAKLELKGLQGETAKKEKNEFRKGVGTIEKFLSFKLNAKTLSVADFYTYKENIDDQAKQKLKDGKNR